MSSSPVAEPERVRARRSDSIKETAPVSRLDSLKNGASRESVEQVSSESSARRSMESRGEKADDDPPRPPLPGTTAPVAQRWNNPRSNIAKVAATFWSFIVMGANDAVYGALIHYIERYYSLSYLVVSIIFLSPLVGYIASAFSNNAIHQNLGQRGVAMICSSCHVAAYIIIVNHPPYPVLVIAYMLAGFGNGLADGGWNAFIGNLHRANEMMGFLHACYGLGAVLSPLIATSMVAKAGLQWYTFYYIMIGGACIELVVLTTCFWTSTAAEYRATLAQHNAGAETKGTLREALVRQPSARVTWLASLFLLGYTGVEVGLGGWIVVFMLNVRGGNEFDSGMTATGFWMGIVVGRVILGFVTPRIGEWLAVAIYCVGAIGSQLLFWLVPQFMVSAVAIGLQGFFLGPLFPAAIMAMSRLLPRHLHVGAIGFAAAFGGTGSSLLPFAIGAIAEAKGVSVLQPIIVAFEAVIFMLWLCMPRFGRKKETDAEKTEHA